MMTRQAFLSYSREDGAQVSGVAQRLQQLGFDVWRDVALHGGQVWWDEILDRIRGCDVFVAVVSTASLKSQACARERSYAEALGKTVVPVAIERIHIPMPADILSRQVVDYTSDSADAAFGLASALIGVPADVPLPESLPTPPEIPLSYLTRLVGLIETSDELTRTRQLGILDDLEPGLRATDPEERDGAWHILGVLEARPDLFADTARRITQLRTEYTSRRARNGPSDPVLTTETGDSPGQAITEADTLGQTPSAVVSSQAHTPETESLTWEDEASEAGEAGDSSEAGSADPIRWTAATNNRPPPASQREPDHQPRRPKWLNVAVVGVLAAFAIWGVLALATGPPDEGSSTAEDARPAVRVESMSPGANVAGMEAELEAVSRATGIEVTYAEFSADQLDSRLTSDDPPDILISGYPGLLVELGAEGAIRPVDAAMDVEALDAAMIPGLVQSTQSPDGATYGVPLSVEPKSLVWRPIPEFEDAGYWIPPSHQEFIDLTTQIKGDGTAPWCFGIEAGDYSGWPMTDWIEEYVLRIGGPDVYDAWVRHEIPFDDPVVKRGAKAAARLLLLEGNTLAGDGQAIAALNWADAASPLLDDPPGCYLHHQGAFIWPWSLPAVAQAELSSRVDVFLLPPYEGGFSGRAVLGGGRIAALVNHDSEDATRVLQSMASPDFGTELAKSDTTFVSPNLDFDRGAYIEELQRSIADIATSASVFRFDGSDQMPYEVGGPSGSFLTAITAWVRGKINLDEALHEVESTWPG